MQLQLEMIYRAIDTDTNLGAGREIAVDTNLATASDTLADKAISTSLEGHFDRDTR